MPDDDSNNIRKDIEDTLSSLNAEIENLLINSIESESKSRSIFLRLATVAGMVLSVGTSISSLYSISGIESFSVIYKIIGDHVVVLATSILGPVIVFYLAGQAGLTKDLAQRFSAVTVDGISNGLGVNTSYEASKKAISDIKNYIIAILLCLIAAVTAIFINGENSNISAWPFLALAAVLFMYKAAVIIRIKRGYYCNNAYELKEFIEYLETASADGQDNFNGKALQEFRRKIKYEAESVHVGGRLA